MFHPREVDWSTYEAPTISIAHHTAYTNVGAMSRYSLGEKVWVKQLKQQPPQWTQASITRINQVTGPLGCPTYAYDLRDAKNESYTFYEMTLKNFGWLHGRLGAGAVISESTLYN